MSMWERFEQWMWYGIMEDYEVAVSLVGLNKVTFTIIMAQRIVIFITMLAYICTKKAEWFSDAFKFFTIWGYFILLFSMLLGTISCWNLRHVLRDEELKQTNACNLVNKNRSIFKSWKWHALLQEIVFHMELQITLLFWVILFPTK